MKPFIKWAGGKRKFAQSIAESIGDIQGRYYEPFLGSGAVLLYIKPRHATCSDVNQELINLYSVVKNHHIGLIRLLKSCFVQQHSKDFYYEVRQWDRNKAEYRKRTDVQRAARFMYLNKTCYNGIWRVNRLGHNNVPMGRYVSPNILNEEDIKAAHRYFNEMDVSFASLDYKECVANAAAGDFVYFDPPYDVDEGQSGFLAYSQSLFNRECQVELKGICDILLERGVRVGVSNSNTSFIRNLYLSDERYHIANEFSVNRTIGGTVDSRRNFSELFIIGEP